MSKPWYEPAKESISTKSDASTEAEVGEGEGMEMIEGEKSQKRRERSCQKVDPDSKWRLASKILGG